MTKEQILESLKSLILKIRDNGDDLLNDPIFKSTWQQKHSALTTARARVSSCDADWIDAELGKWFAKEIKPHIDKLDPEFLLKFTGQL